MKKAIIALLAAVMLLAVPVTAAEAATNKGGKVIDNAGVLSSSQVNDLEKKAKATSEAIDMDVVILTVNEELGDYVEKYGESYMNYVADDLLDRDGFSNDNLCVAINMYDRNWAISYEGTGIKTFNKEIEKLEDAIIKKLSNSDYYGAFSDFLDTADSIANPSFKAARSGIIAVIVGLIVGLIRSGSMKSKLKTVVEKSEANDYVRSGSFNLENSLDIYLYTKRTTRTVHDDDGPATHTSSSGDTHGGSHGTF